MPHRLYGHVPPATRYSVGALARRCRGRCLHEAEAAGALPIVVGGTGLYFKALTEGLAAMPRHSAGSPSAWAERLAAEGAAALHAALASAIRSAAAAIRPSDPQRVLRALEVLEATGRPLAEWQMRGAAAAARRSRTKRRASCSSRTARRSTGGSRRASTAWSRRARVDEVRGLLARDSIRSCRR